MDTQAFLDKAYKSAVDSGHIFPEFAACEAALESAWGESRLAKEANNLFGQKHGKDGYPTLSINTKEYLNGAWVVVPAAWPIFPDWKTAFSERMALLNRLAPRYPHYANALKSTTGKEFIEEVSKSWSTDPLRSVKVLTIYNKHFPK